MSNEDWVKRRYIQSHETTPVIDFWATIPIPADRLERFTIRRTQHNKIAFLFTPDGTFPAFETETALDMKLLLVRLLKECDALEPKPGDKP